MTAGLKAVICPVKDLDRAKPLFTALLGAEPQVDQPYHVGYRGTGQDVGLDPDEHAAGPTGPVPHGRVADIRGTLAALPAAGAEPLRDVRDVGDGRLIASVKDADGDLIGLLQDPPAA
ncbi:hypothetical protein GCM10010129_60460 [Streptomyces fumigatiscleroticus]|nr:hypothetical protein GCM10010129_60460 [Streptomyces fumigatiscleroticus]